MWPARLLCPWDFPGKNTGVGCHFLLQFVVQLPSPTSLGGISASFPRLWIVLCWRACQFLRGSGGSDALDFSLPYWLTVSLHKEDSLLVQTIFLLLFFTCSPQLPDPELGSPWNYCAMDPETEIQQMGSGVALLDSNIRSITHLGQDTGHLPCEVRDGNLELSWGVNEVKQ